MIGEERPLIHTIRNKLLNGLDSGHAALRGDSLLRMTIEGKTVGKRMRGRRRQMLVDWMMADGYGKLKEETQQ